LMADEDPGRVTDPELLRKLNASRAADPGRVTDPELLRKLNASRETPQPKLSGWMDFLKSIPRGAVEGLLSSSGGDPDVVAAQIGMGQSPEAIISEQKKIQTEQPKAIAGLQKQTGYFPEPQGMFGRMGASIGRSIGDPGTYIGPAGWMRKVASGVAGGLGAELGGALTKDSFAGRLIGGLAGGVVPGTAGAVGRRIAAPVPMLRPTERAADIAHLRSRGIEPTAGDFSGRPSVRGAEEMGAQLGGAGSYEAVKAPPLRQFTEAVTEDMGMRVPRVVPDEPGVPGTITQVEDRLGRVFEDTANRLPIEFDPRLGRDLHSIRVGLFREGLPDATINRVLQQIENIVGGFVTYTARGVRRPRGSMTGETYQSLTRRDTPLGRAIRDPDVNVAHYAQRIRRALDDAMQRTVDVAVRNAFRRGRPGGPAQARAIDLAEAQEQLREARRQWFVKGIVQDAISQAGPDAASGVILPKHLRTALTRGADNKKAYTQAQTRLQRLSIAANAILTPARSMDLAERAKLKSGPAAVGTGIGALVGGYPGAAAGAAAGAVGTGTLGRLINTPVGQRWLKAQRGPNPPSVQMLIDATRGAYVGRSREKREPLRLTVYGGTDAD
jgi:hypothetical protein